MELYDLTCEYQKNALGIGTNRPVFGWKLKSSQNGDYQTAYQIVVSDTQNHTLYDSGKTDSAEQTGVETDLSGQIMPFTKYKVKIRAWDQDGAVSNYEESIFVTGIFKAHQWVGTWFDATWGHFGEAAFFRREFDIKPGKIEYAFLYLGSIGEKAPAAAIYLNGQPVGNLPNFPGATETFHAVYTCVDVTEMLSLGRNTLGLLMLKRASCILVVQYQGGKRQWVCADRVSWKYDMKGPYLELGYQDPVQRGKVERYDARLNPEGWNKNGFDDRKWTVYGAEPCDISWGPLFISPQYCSAREMQVFAPVQVLRREDSWLLDFGVNLSGFVSFRLKGTAGETISIHYAEKLDENQLHGVSSSFHPSYMDYTFATNEVEAWQPRFMMTGFRYIEVTGYTGEIITESFRAHFIHSDVLCGTHFLCSEPALNRLNEVARRSFLCNLVNIPTDCPERERRGWTADAYAVCEAETVNFNMLNFYYQWFTSMEDCQRGNGWIPVELPMSTEECIDVDWPAACVIIPSVLYAQYGDARFLRRFYPMMKKYVDMLLEICDDSFGLSDLFLSYKDWLASEKASSGFIGRAYFYRCTSLLAKIAELLGYQADASSYGRTAEDMRSFLNQNYFHHQKDGASYDNNTQSANAHALFFGICPSRDREAVAKALVENIHKKGGNTTGFMGTMCLLDALSENGCSEEAFRLLMNPNPGGWLYLIDVCKVTTFPENYDGSQSQNHAFLGGAPGLWLYKYLLGISPLEPGYRKIRIQPYVPERLSYAQAELETCRGTLKVRWEQEADGVTFHLQIPVNATAELAFGGVVRQLPSGVHEIRLAKPTAHKN